MKKIFYGIAAFLLAGMVSCSGWDPVFTNNYDEPEMYKPVTLETTKTISELKAMYVNNPIHIEENIVIGGQVISNDRMGNIYKSIFIQDKTGAIELKLGKNGLYNDYKPGQWVYVKCEGLTLGAYNGVIQLGYGSDKAEYETSYIEVDNIINTHIFRGECANPVEPIVLEEGDLLKPEYFNRYVTVKGLKYGCNPDKYTGATKQIFTLIYIDPMRDHKDMSNRIFISGDDFGVTTWSMSKLGFLKYLKAGNFDSVERADRSGVKVADLKETLIKNANAVQMSQYFLCGSTDFQIRTSGYSRFADSEIPAEVLSGEKKINVTGILGNYKGAVQFTLIDLGGVEVVD